MWQVIGAVLIPLLKWILSMANKKKLSDKEFVDYILASQKKKARAGEASIEFEDAMDVARAESAAKRAAKRAGEGL